MDSGCIAVFCRAQVIPPPGREYASTPAGLLLNEITQSPASVLVPMQRMLKLALALNTGKYAEPQALVILFVVWSSPLPPNLCV